MTAEAFRRQREEIIRQYMLGWLNADETLLLETLSPQVCITESHGPVYAGLEEVQQWFRAWQQAGQVLQWDQLGWWHQGNEVIVKWAFRYRYEGNVDGFDGLSLVRFDQHGLIAAMEEYQSKTEHHRPYAATKTPYS